MTEKASRSKELGSQVNHSICSSHTFHPKIFGKICLNECQLEHCKMILHSIKLYVGTRGSPHIKNSHVEVCLDTQVLF